MMSPFSIVVVCEFDEFAFKIPVVPKKGMAQVFATNRSNQSFNECRGPIARPIKKWSGSIPLSMHVIARILEHRAVRDECVFRGNVNSHSGGT